MAGHTQGHGWELSPSGCLALSTEQPRGGGVEQIPEEGEGVTVAEHGG